jgi:hypothetical protein
LDAADSLLIEEVEVIDSGKLLSGPELLAETFSTIFGALPPFPTAAPLEWQIAGHEPHR